MPQPAPRSSWQGCDALRSRATPRGTPCSRSPSFRTYQDRADVSVFVILQAPFLDPRETEVGMLVRLAAAHDGRNPFHGQLWRKRVAGGEGPRSGGTLDPASPSRTHRSGPEQTIAQRQRVDPQHGPGEQHPGGPKLHGRAGPHPHGMNHPAQCQGDGARDHQPRRDPVGLA
jgi:hypothetical protein